MALRANMCKSYNLDSNHNPIPYNPFVLESDAVNRYDFYVVSEFLGTMLYEYGNEYVPWSDSDCYIDGLGGTNKYSQYFEMYTTRSAIHSHISFYAVDKIDITDFSKLYAEVECDIENNNNALVNFSFRIQNNKQLPEIYVAGTGIYVTQNKRFLVELNISSFDGYYYVGFLGRLPTDSIQETIKLKVHRVWME